MQGFYTEIEQEIWSLKDHKTMRFTVVILHIYLAILIVINLVVFDTAVLN